MEHDRIDPRHMEQARRARSPEELLQTAEREGVPLTPEEAERAFALLHPATGEVSDEELDAVSGGGCGHPLTCPRCNSANVTYKSDSWKSGYYVCLRCGYRGFQCDF